MTRSAGHCNPMGTASTMASMVEALGFTLPDNAAIPAPDARRRRSGEQAALSIEQVAAAIVLFETPGVGPTQVRRRLEDASDALEALRAAPARDRARRRWEDRRRRQTARRRARRFLDAGGRLLQLSDADFPARCRALAWTPGCLYVRGEAPWPARLASIVGTRRALPSALAFTRIVAFTRSS